MKWEFHADDPCNLPQLPIEASKCPDLGAICAAARKCGAILGVDNIFATPLNHRIRQERQHASDINTYRRPKPKQVTERSIENRKMRIRMNDEEKYQLNRATGSAPDLTAEEDR
jgi:hypothetical protein